MKKIFLLTIVLLFVGLFVLPGTALADNHAQATDTPVPTETLTPTPTPMISPTITYGDYADTAVIVGLCGIVVILGVLAIIILVSPKKIG